MKNIRILLCALGMLAISIGAAACGDDEDEGTTAAEETTTEDAGTVSVTATDDIDADEYNFDLSAIPTADTKEVTFQNDGESPHELIFVRINEGFTLDEAIKAEGEEGTTTPVGFTFAKPGEEAKPIEVKKPLEAGPYVMLCTVETKDKVPHFELGQLEEFEIE